MTIAADPAVHRLTVASSVEEALEAVADGASPLAGATWVMRAPLRDEPMAAHYVAIGAIPELRELEVGDEELTIGAAVSHTALAAALGGARGFEALATAAATSANPGIRNMATVGGNVCADGFAAADLVPALLALDAEVELISATGTERIDLPDLLAERTHRDGAIVSRLHVRARPARSAHARLTLRAAGDYPVANVSIALDLDGSEVAAARVAVGSVEPVARRWGELEDRLSGQVLDPSAARQAAAELAGGFEARDGVEAKGWYRTSVLPVLVERAMTELAS